MTGLEATTAVAKYLNENRLAIFGDEKGKVFKYEKKKGFRGEYIAVNNLPFVHRDELQACTINVNIHVPKLQSEQPDTARLTELANSVIILFDSKYGTLLDGARFKYYSDSRPTEDNDNTWYVNIGLECTFENINN